MLFAMFGVGPMEMVVLAIVMVLLFGNKLPGVMRSLGSSIIEFKKGVNGVTDEVQDAADAVNRESRDVSRQLKS